MAEQTAYTQQSNSALRKFFRYLGVGRILLKLSNLVNKAKRFSFACSLYFYNSFLTHFPSYSVRTFYLRKVIGIKIGKKTSIHMGCFFAGKHVIIGNNTVVARNCHLDGRGGLIEIKDNVSIAPEVCILSMTHIANSPIFEALSKPVLIEEYVWLATRAMVLPGVTLGKGAIVGANTVISKDVEAYSIMVGAPAIKIGERTRDLNYTLEYFPYFNTDVQP